MTRPGLTELVQSRMTDLGLKPVDLATRAGLTKSYVSALLKGKVALPGADKRRDLARVLGVRHVDLLIAAGELSEDEVDPSKPLYSAGSAKASVVGMLDTMTEREAAGLAQAGVLLMWLQRGDELPQWPPLPVVEDQNPPMANGK